MRVLHFSFGKTPVPAILGGAVQQIIEDLAIRLSNKTINVTVISIANEKYKKQLEEYNKSDVKYIHIFHKSQKMDFLRLLPRIVKEVVKNGPYDIVQLHSPIWIPLFKMIHKFIGSPKIIWQVHNKTKYAFFAKKQNIKVVGVSNAVLHTMRYNLVGNEQTVIHNYIDSNNFPMLNEEEKKLLRVDNEINKSKIILGYAGRISPEKGLHVLLESLRYLPRDVVKNIKILIAGSSWFKNAEPTEYENQLFIESEKYDIKWLGYIDNWELYKFYNMCDALIVPSVIEEAAGMVVIEAQTCGTKIIASNIGGIPEYLSPHESTFIAGNAESLAREIKAFINSGDNSERKTKRSKWIKDHLNSDSIVEKWLEIYSSIN